jgi:dTDP-glucose 4,6-dehydratase
MPPRSGIRVNVSITHCCNNYGAYQYSEKVIPLFSANSLDGKPVLLYGDGLNVCAWIHVDDHCRGIQVVLERGAAGRAYSIDGDVELSNRELTAAIPKACGASWDMVGLATDRKGHDRRYSLDDPLLWFTRYTPRVPIADGLKAAIEWYTDNHEWWESLHRPAQPARPTEADGASKADQVGR